MKRIATILIMISLFKSDNSFPQSNQNDISLVSIAYSIKDSIQERTNTMSSSGHDFLNYLAEIKMSGRSVLGFTKGKRPVEAWYFPGVSSKNAVVIGGMHGSELSSIELAYLVIELLTNEQRPYYNVIVIPSLFPDNAAKALAIDQKTQVNTGRYSSFSHADPNRQMPELGKSFDPVKGYDHAGRQIEEENKLLLELLQQFNPERIVNLHAIRDIKKAGIYADPRTDCHGVALGFQADSLLAVSMAKYISLKEGYVPGNKLENIPTALYYNDPPAAGAGRLQKRNLNGSALPNNRGFGVSLGGWASTAVCEGLYQREAIVMITVEFPGYRPSMFYENEQQRQNCLKNLKLYAASVRNIFLEN